MTVFLAICVVGLVITVMSLRSRLDQTDERIQALARDIMRLSR